MPNTDHGRERRAHDGARSGLRGLQAASQPRRPTPWLHLAANRPRTTAAVAMAACLACSEPPTAPETTPPPPPAPPTVAAVTVTSPIGSLIPLGVSVALGAAVTDAGGQPLTVSVAWSVGDTAVLRVAADGTLSAEGVGATAVTATAQGVGGTLDVTVVDADLEGIGRLLDDPLVDRALLVLGGTSEASLRASFTTCASGRGSGNLTQVRDCIADARDALARTPGDAVPLAGLLALFVDWLDRLLNLT